MNDGVESLKVLGRDIPNVAGALFIAIGLGAEIASVVPADVESYDLMASRSHEGNENRADVAAVAGY